MKYDGFMEDIKFLQSKRKDYILITQIAKLNELGADHPLFKQLNPASLPVFVQYIKKFDILKVFSPESILKEKGIITTKLPLAQNSSVAEIKELVSALYQSVLEFKKTADKEFFIIEKKLEKLEKKQ